MAVDTRDKRMSMMGFISPTPRMMPNPDGTIATQDRAMFATLYHGIALDNPSPPSGKGLVFKTPIFGGGQ